MSAQFLMLAQAGVNLLQSVGGIAAASTARSNARQQRRLVEAQITREARADAEDRQRLLTSLLGSQRTAMAANGVVGGATAAAIPALTRVAVQRQQDAADYSTLTRRQGAQFQEMGVRQQARLDTVKAFTDLLTSGMEGADNIKQAGGFKNVLGMGT